MRHWLAAWRGASAAISADPTIRAADDFYGYANAAWIRSTHLPDGQSSLDTSSMLRAQNSQRVRDLIEGAAKARTRGGARPDVGKIADYYASRLDMAGIEARGMVPLSADLAAIAAISDRHALATWLGRTLRLDDGTNTQTESLWGIWIHQGFHDPYHEAAHLVQGGLGLDQSTYLDSTPDGAERRARYRTHIANVLKLGGLDRPEARAQRVLDLEIAIAGTHASRADTDDVFKTDNEWRSADFADKAPGLDWAGFFSAPGWSPASRSTPGRTISPSTSSSMMRLSCRGLSGRSAAPSTRTCPARRRSRRRTQRYRP